MASRLSAIFLLLLAAAPLSFSANCGGAVPCACGDTLIASWTMTSDLGPCSGDGLVLGASGITLDCAGHSITGTGTGNGIYSNQANIAIKNCLIANFLNGITPSSTGGNLFENNTIYNVGQNGISVTGTGNIVRHNRLANTTGGYGIVVLGSNQNLLTNNTIQNFTYCIGLNLGSSYNNVSSSSLLNCSTGIRLVGGSSHNIVSDSMISSTSYSIELAGTPSINNTLLNTSFERDRVYYDGGGSNATVKWYARVRVLDVRGMGISGAAVNVSDALGRLEFQGTTDANGFTPWFVSNDSLLGYGAVDFNNHTINASKNPFNTTTANITSTQTIEITLNYTPVSSEPRNENEWPMFRRSLNHTAYVNARGPMRAELLWTYATGNTIYSSPTVANGVVYVGSDNLYAVNASNGALVWSYPTGLISYSSPAVADGVVYVGSYDGNLYAVNASNGALVWRYPTGSYIVSSPAVANGVVYVGSG
ncbi:MAG: PQQ-binding-like beta-propeller repeat protein [Candidatus Micrarchaeia archaeon]